MQSSDTDLKRSTRSMRLKKQREDESGYRRSTVALSPVSLAISERLRVHLDLGSREAVINAVFERIDRDMYLKYEFLGPAGFRSPPTPRSDEPGDGEALDQIPRPKPTRRRKRA